MGTPLTDGEHLFVDHQHPEHYEALKVLSVEIESLKDQYDCTNVILRDLDPNDQALHDIFHAQGYLKIDMPEGAVIESLDWVGTEDYLNSLTYKSRAHVRRDVLRHENSFSIQVKEKLSANELKHAYFLYQEVGRRNFGLNVIEYPFALFEAMNEDERWEAIVFKLKEAPEGEAPMIGVSFSYKADDSYCGLLLGMDYKFTKEHKTYKQILFRNVLRAHELGKQKMYLGLSSVTEKKKLGATIKPKIAYTQSVDNYKLEVIEAIDTNLPLTNTILPS